MDQMINRIKGPANLLFIALLLSGCYRSLIDKEQAIIKYTAYSRNTPYRVIYTNDKNKWVSEEVYTNYWLKVITVGFKANFRARIERIGCTPNDSIVMTVDTKYNGTECRMYKPGDWNSCSVSAKNY